MCARWLLTVLQTVSSSLRLPSEQTRRMGRVDFFFRNTFGPWRACRQHLFQKRCVRPGWRAKGLKVDSCEKCLLMLKTEGRHCHPRREIEP
jgi:hypothetical protein